MSDQPNHSPSLDDIQYSQAMWYAWGRQDAGDKLPGTPYEFGDVRLKAWREGGNVNSIQGQFAAWSGLPEQRPPVEPHEVGLCGPCCDGEHGTVEDGHCICCGQEVGQ